MRIPTLGLVLATAALAFATPATAQNTSIERVVSMQLDAAVELFESEGYALQGRYVGGALADGGREAHTVQLRGGFNYVILGVCDSDCSDLDLVLLDSSGRQLDADFELDDVPIVTTDVDADGSFRVEVSMASCSIEPCYYGFGIFARRQ